MGVHPTIRQGILDHLDKGAFELRVATNFDAIKGTPAHESLKAALAEVAKAREAVRVHLEVESPKPKPFALPLGHGLPLTRKERLGHRWP